MKEMVIVLAIALLVGMAFPIGINQDYPTSFTMQPGESGVYGIRIANPSDDCVAVKVTDVSPHKVSQILSMQTTYYLSPKSVQKIFIRITIPTDAYQATYSIKYSFNEVARTDADTMVDITMGAKSGVTVKVGGDGVKMQTHPQAEIDEALSAAPAYCDATKKKVAVPKTTETPAAQNEAQVAAEGDATTESATAQNASTMKEIAGANDGAESIAEAVKAVVTPAKPKPTETKNSTAGALMIAKNPNEFDPEEGELLGTMGIAVGALAVAAFSVEMMYRKKRENEEKLKEKQEPAEAAG